MAPRLLPSEKDDLELEELNVRRKQPGFLPGWDDGSSDPIKEQTFNTEAAMIPPPPSNTPWSSSMPSWNTNLSSVMRNQSMSYPSSNNNPRSEGFKFNNNRLQTEYDRWLKLRGLRSTDSTNSYAYGQDNSLSGPEQFMKERYSPQSTMYGGSGKQLFNMENIPGPREVPNLGGDDKSSLYGKLWQGLQLVPDIWTAYNQGQQADAMKAQAVTADRAVDNKQAQWNTANLQNIATWNNNQDRIKRVILGRRPGDTVEEQNKATAHLTYL